jgi:hypothetical protein
MFREERSQLAREVGGLPPSTPFGGLPMIIWLNRPACCVNKEIAGEELEWQQRGVFERESICEILKVTVVPESFAYVCLPVDDSCQARFEQCSFLFNSV